jgi:hypothetical protein
MSSLSDSHESYDADNRPAASTKSRHNEGTCVVGTAEGTVYFLSLQCGMKLFPPLVLGTAVVFADIVPQSDNRENLSVPFSLVLHSGSGVNDSQTSNQLPRDVKVLVMTVDGQLKLWIITNQHLIHDMTISTKPILQNMQGRMQFSHQYSLGRASVDHRTPTVTDASSNRSEVETQENGYDRIVKKRKNDPSVTHNSACKVIIQKCFFNDNGCVICMVKSEHTDDRGNPMDTDIHLSNGHCFSIVYSKLITITII